MPTSPISKTTSRMRNAASFGVWNCADAAAVTALGLHALQHRGQTASGIVTYRRQPSFTQPSRAWAWSATISPTRGSSPAAGHLGDGP